MIFSYTFDKERGRCFMKAAISESYKTSGMTSGIKANTHSGHLFLCFEQLRRTSGGINSDEYIFAGNIDFCCLLDM